MPSAWLSVALLENLFLSLSEGCIFTCCAYTNDHQKWSQNDLLSATWVLISCYCSVKLITKRAAWQQLDMVSLITVTGSKTRPNDTTVRMCLFILSLYTILYTVHYNHMREGCTCNIPACGGHLLRGSAITRSRLYHPAGSYFKEGCVCD